MAIHPGTIVFALIPYLACSTVIPLIIALTPPFEAEYGWVLAAPSIPARLAIPTTDPPGSPFFALSTICLQVSLSVKNTPSRLTDNIFL